MSGAVPSAVHAAAHEALARGDVFAAYDLATGVAQQDGELAYIEVRALAGMGDWQGALSRYEAAGVGARGDIDSLALRGRILKDAAFAAPPEARHVRFAEAAEAYGAVHAAKGDYYSAINAAAMAAMAGDAATAQRFARTALEGAQDAPVQDYWAHATAAEALLLLGRGAEAEAMLQAAAVREGATVAARASTYRQFTALLASPACAGVAVSLDPIRPPRTAVLTGHMFCEDPVAEARIAAAVRAALEAERIGAMFGPLACGADIVIAETCLALGIEFHVILPFAEEDFLALSVRPGGPGWEARFRRCLGAAVTIHRASAMRYVGDDTQIAFGSEVAMGLARLRAAQLGGEAVQIAVWDSAYAGGIAGAGADVMRWRSVGGRTVVIDGAGLPRARGSFTPVPTAGAATERALRVIVFTDFKGFSRLPEPVIPQFWSDVMGRCGAVLMAHRAEIRCLNTWGDALYLALEDVRAAAAVLCGLQEALAGIDAEALGLPPGSGMRIAAHYGSVYAVDDPVTGMPNYYGTEVSRAARLEPIAPPRQVYVTEPMAAAIEMTCRDAFVCRYVGQRALDKDFGIERIYRLERSMVNGSFVIKDS
ncbi:adenylate/guanylate cyclase domain-containing protein [Novosphingobium sp.]|uniref:adenylate/guanylate cyclase domain-containing protein n=1 Tax=Novosphingobium sp. TaxID=1874826 RepID=UPI0026157D77|nr:adenylate/guanylate cyclase domain-containing protein [Novosphingobium sp.]